MAARSKKDRIGAIIDAVNQAAAGDYPLMLPVSSKNDEIDLLADAVNKMLKKTAQRITSQEQVEPGKNISENHFRNILDTIEESYFEVDLKGNLQFYNDTVLRDLGYTASEIKGMNFRQLVDQKHTEKLIEVFTNVYVTRKAIKGFDWEILKKNGDIIPVESSVNLRHNEQGKPIGFRGVVRDSTQRKLMEKELRQSEERYRTFLDIIGEAYLEYDLSGKITFTNNAACKLFGYEQNELIGVNYQ
jgi:PAS domain S-box-containing protein